MKFDIVSTASTIGSNTLGVEVTTPEVAARCDLGNIDPQHGQGTLNIDARAACDAAVKWPLPTGGTLVTERPDVDSVCAMAVIALRAAGVGITDATRERLAIVAGADNFAAGARPWAPYPLPTTDRLWPEQRGAVADTPALGAIGAICSPRRGQTEHPIAFRVACAAAWLIGGDDPSRDACEVAYEAVLADDVLRSYDRVAHPYGPGEYQDIRAIGDALRGARAVLDEHRREVVRSIEDGRTTALLVRRNGEIGPFSLRYAHRPPVFAEFPRPGDPDVVLAIIESEEATLSIGYALAPIQIAVNPAHKWPAGYVTRKYTIAFWTAPSAERFATLVDALNSAEQAAREAAAEGEAQHGNPDTAAEIAASALTARWGGNAKSGIIGSPVGRASAMTDAQIVKILLDLVSSWQSRTE